MSKTKIIAMYLPQYHQIPENDEFWGKGFTDWVTVKNAKPLYDGHQQPRVPLNDNYYDLSLKENVEWQAKLAREHGIYGFGIYHYWFNNEKNLLTKPAEIILENKDIDINFHFAWDNISWKRSWDNVKEKGNDWAPIIDKGMNEHKGPAVLVPYVIGNEEDWKKHFDWLLPFFRDSRYIKVSNKPVFTILHNSGEVKLMCEFWNKLAQECGFEGMYFIFKFGLSGDLPREASLFKYEPGFSAFENRSLGARFLRKIKQFCNYGLRKYRYDEVWEKIIVNAKKMSKKDIYHSAFVSFDDTPRRGFKGRLISGASPEKFEKYLSELFAISESQHKEFIFLTAMNEWGEGAYLEPDSVNGYKYLEVIKRITNGYEK